MLTSTRHTGARVLPRRLMDTLIRWAPGVGIVRLVLHASPARAAPLRVPRLFASNEMFFPALHYTISIARRLGARGADVLTELALRRLLSECRAETVTS